MALCEQGGSIDKSFIREKIGTVSEEDMFKIEIAMMRQQGININNVYMFVKNMKQLQYAETKYMKHLIFCIDTI